MKHFMLTLVSTWWISLLSAQSLLLPIGKNAGIGSYSRHFQQIVSVWNHPAGLSDLPVFSAGIYSENRFLLKAASLYAVMMAFPTPGGTFGGSLVRLGNSAWHQQQLSGAYGRNLGRRAGIGLQFNYESTAVQGAGTASALSVDAGILWHYNERVHTGLQVRKGSGKEVSYSGGAGFEASRDCLLTAMVTSTGSMTSIKAAVYYRLISALALEMGIASGPAYHNAAVIFYLRSLRIDIAAGFHPQLGITPSTSLIWQPATPPAAE